MPLKLLKLAETDSIFAVGHYEEAQERAKEALDRARSSGDRLGEAQALFWVFTVEVASDRLVSCAEIGPAALAAAERAGDDELWIGSLKVWLRCVSAGGKPGAAEILHSIGARKIDEGGLAGAQVADFERWWANHLKSVGDIEGARAAGLRALDAAVAHYGPDNVNLGGYYNALGNAFRGHPEDLELSEKYYTKALRLFRRDYGPDHVNVGHLTNNISIIHMDRGQYARARAGFEHAMQIYRRAWGDDTTRVAAPLANLCSIATVTAHYDLALEQCARVMEIRNEAHGKDNKKIGTYFEGLAAAAEGLGRREEALGNLREAVRLAEMHQQLGKLRATRAMLVSLLLRAGRAGEAAQIRSVMPESSGTADVFELQMDLDFSREDGDAPAMFEAARGLVALAPPGGSSHLHARAAGLEARALGATESLAGEAALEADIARILGESHPMLGRVLLARAMLLSGTDRVAARKLAVEARRLMGAGISVPQERALDTLR